MAMALSRSADESVISFQEGKDTVIYLWWD